MSDYVNLLIEFTKDYESPTSFWKWSAYSTIAATLRNNVYLQHKVGKVYPNTYTVFLADSARFRKGMPLIIANDLLTEINNTKIFNGTASIQGIIDKLAVDIPIKGKGTAIKGGSCLILAEELAAFFVEDPRLLKLLTNIYDYKPNFPYELRGGSINVKELCVTLLGGSNETYLREFYTSQAVYGGLLRRTLLIKPDKPRPANSLFDPDRQIDHTLAANQKAELLKILVEISKMSGPMTLDYQAAKVFDNWYTDLYNNYEKYGSKTGVVEGIHTLIQKIAIAKAASKGTMTINQELIEEAIIEVSSLVPNYQVYTMQAGESEDKIKITVIINFLWKAQNYTARKQDILMKHFNDLSSDDFDRVIKTLTDAALVEFCPNGMSPSFMLTKKAVEGLESRLKKP